MAKASEKKADKKTSKSTPAKKAAPSPAKALAKTPISSKEIIAKAKEQVRRETYQHIRSLMLKLFIGKSEDEGDAEGKEG